LSNALAFLRLSCGACLLGIVACAQGIQSPVTDEDLTDTGGSSGALSGSGATSVSSSGALGTSGSTSQGGAFGVSGSGSSSAGASPGGSSTGGSSAGGTTSSQAGAGGTGTAGAGTAGSSTSLGGGTGAQGCTFAQPGDVGFALQYKWENATDSIYFDVEIDNPNQRTVTIGDLKFRYYLVTSDLGTLTTDFYLKQIKRFNGTTQDLDVTPTATVTATYLEISFPGSASTLATTESLTIKVHAHNSNYTIHDETNDYSYSPSTTLIPWCKIVLYEQTAIAWGTPPP
jgi:hypothetical protein